MNCQNCGAPMTLVGERDYFHCAYCGSVYFAEGPRGEVRMQHKPAGQACPVCKVPLVVADIEGTRAAACERCRGVLIQQAGFVDVVRILRTHHRRGVPSPRVTDLEALKQQRRCPMCAQWMDTHPYYGGGNAIVSVCGRCNLVWLDGDQIERIKADQEGPTP